MAMQKKKKKRVVRVRREPSASADLEASPAAVEATDVALQKKKKKKRVRRKPPAVPDLEVSLLLPSKEEVRQAASCLSACSVIARELEGDCILFGSWAQETHLAGSDVDVALVFSDEPYLAQLGDKARKTMLLRRFRRKALREGFTLIEEIYSARVPVLRLAYAHPGIEDIKVDVSIGSHQTGRLDDFIREQVCAMPHAQPLIRLVKHWARCREVNQALMGCLNSLSWTLLVFFHVTGSGYTPELQLRLAFRDFLQCVKRLGKYPDANRCILPFKGRYGRRQSYHNEQVMVIEDPTDCYNNVAYCLRQRSWQVTLAEVRRALELLDEGAQLRDVCGGDVPPREHLVPRGLRAKVAKRRAEQDGSEEGQSEPEVPAKRARKGAE